MTGKALDMAEYVGAVAVVGAIAYPLYYFLGKIGLDDGKVAEHVAAAVTGAAVYVAVRGATKCLQRRETIRRLENFEN